MPSLPIIQERSCSVKTTDDTQTNMILIRMDEDATVVRVEFVVLAALETDQFATWKCEYSFCRELATSTIRLVGTGAKSSHVDPAMSGTDVIIGVGGIDSDCIAIDVIGNETTDVQWSFHGIIYSYRYTWE